MTDPTPPAQELVRYFVFCDHTPDELIGRNVYLAAPADSLLSALRGERDVAEEDAAAWKYTAQKLQEQLDALRGELADISASLLDVVTMIDAGCSEQAIAQLLGMSQDIAALAAKERGET
jgi:hypothetical protein